MEPQNKVWKVDVSDFQSKILYLCMLLSTDNDLQGSDCSGSLGGLDVRRRIPIKLISKPPLRTKPPLRLPRPIGNRPCKSEPGEDGRQCADFSFLFLILNAATCFVAFCGETF